MSEALLEVCGLTGFLTGRAGARRILDRVDLTVHAGRSCALLGESGSGKTFLAQALLGLHAGSPGVVAGDARLLGVDVFAGLADHVSPAPPGEDAPGKDANQWNRLQRRRLAAVVGRSATLVPQDPLTALPPYLTVAQLLERALRHGGRRGSQPPRRLAASWLERVHMYQVEEVLGRYVHELSGGMAQRVALALALAPGPRLMIADEPTTGLDATLRVRILELLRDVAAEYAVTLFLITHDVQVARLLADEVVVLCAGRVVERGPAARVLAAAGARSHPYTAYLLQAERILDGDDERAPLAAGRVAGDGGCPYSSACPRCSARCGGGAPPLQEVAPDHFVACCEVGP